MTNPDFYELLSRDGVEFTDDGQLILLKRASKSTKDLFKRVVDSLNTHGFGIYYKMEEADE